MIVVGSRLYCDSTECDSAFPEPGPVLADIFALRTAAEKKGWRRCLGEDLCPACFRRLSQMRQERRLA